MVRLRTSVGCIASLGVMTGGCLSLEALSSYSAGTAPSEGSIDVIDASTGGTSSGGSGGDVPVILDAGTGSNEPGLDAAIVAPDASAAQACEGPGEFAGLAPTTCYRQLDALATWATARSSCQDWGGDLVEVTTPAVNELIAAEVDDSVWIGANDLQNEGEMVWVSGAPVEYANWAQAQPDDFQGEEDCVERRTPDGLWNDAPCGGAKRAICERSD